MTEQERKNCQKASIYLKKISLLGLVILVTIPVVLRLFDANSQTTLFLEIAVVFTGLIVLFRGSHLYFDAQLLQKLASGKMDLKAVDKLILKLFNKKIQNKTLEDRITGSHKLTRGFFVFLFIHLLCFGVFFWILSK
jgi:hypothetical protein